MCLIIVAVKQLSKCGAGELNRGNGSRVNEADAAALRAESSFGCSADRFDLRHVVVARFDSDAIVLDDNLFNF